MAFLSLIKMTELFKEDLQYVFTVLLERSDALWARLCDSSKHLPWWRTLKTPRTINYVAQQMTSFARMFGFGQA